HSPTALISTLSLHDALPIFQPWLELRVGLPVGPLFCVLNGRTRGRQWSTAAARAELRRTAVAAGVRHRFAPHQLRHAHAVEMARDRKSTRLNSSHSQISYAV